MAAPAVFRIENGVLALSLVDKTVVGPPAYDDSWQAPGGKDLSTVTLADYTTADGIDFSCQVTSGALTASPNTTDQTRAATFCEPEAVTTSVGITSYTLDAEFFQDPHVSTGISRYLFEHDTKEAYFYLGLDDDNPPTAIGRLRLISGAIGGAARTDLTATLSLPLSRKPDIEFGDATTSDIVEGGGAVTFEAPAPASTGAGSATASSSSSSTSEAA